MKYIALTLAFLLELVAFFAFAAAGILVSSNIWARVGTGLLLFVGLIVFWSLFMAPKAIKKFSILPYYVAKFCIYAIAAHVLFKVFGPTYTWAFAIIALLDEAVLMRHNLS